MAVVDDGLDALRDLRAKLENDAAGCHVLINLKRGRTREDRWKRLVTQDDLANKFTETVTEAIVSAHTLAAEPDGISEFDFDNINLGALGVLRLDEFPDLQQWLGQVPGNDWNHAFRPTAETRRDLHHYVLRVTFANGETLETFRSSRGARIYIEHGGIHAWFQRDADIARPAADGFMSFDEKIDFFAWDGFLFITNLASFESITNIRVATQRQAHAAIDAMTGRFGFGDANVFKATIASKVSLAKKLAAAIRHGLIEAIDADRVMARIQEKNLDLECRKVDGKVVFDVDPSDMKQATEIVNLISDVYLHSPVTQKEWRALVKKPAWT